MNRTRSTLAALCLLGASASATSCQTQRGFLGGSTARQPASFNPTCTRTDQKALGTLVASLKGHYPWGTTSSDAESYRVKDFRTGLADAANAFDRINYGLNARGTLDSAAGRWAVFTSRDHPTRHYLVYGLLGKASDVIYLVFLSGELWNMPPGPTILPPPEIY